MAQIKHVPEPSGKYDDYENGKLDGFNEGYTQGREDAIIEHAEVVRQQEKDKLLYNLQTRVNRIEDMVELIKGRKSKPWYHY